MKLFPVHVIGIVFPKGMFPHDRKKCMLTQYILTSKQTSYAAVPILGSKLRK